jgi:hypothetical protein
MPLVDQTLSVDYQRNEKAFLHVYRMTITNYRHVLRVTDQGRGQSSLQFEEMSDFLPNFSTLCEIC